VTKAYVETTVLADALLKPGPRATAAKAAIGRFDQSLLPVYSIKEFKAGPLNRYVWFHGKLVQTKSWEKSLEQLRRMGANPYRGRWLSTGVEELEAAAHRRRKVTLGQLVMKYGELATEDRFMCDSYRLTLGNLIRTAWKHRRKLTTAIVGELSCYSEGEITEERELFEFGELKCCPKDECALAEELRRNLESLKKLRDAVKAQSPKQENLKRLKVLREFIRVPKQKLSPKQCVALGDAIFAFCCPSDATILTTNLTDIRPLADALGKRAEGP
jgi:hypothetical protein